MRWCGGTARDPAHRVRPPVGVDKTNACLGARVPRAGVHAVDGCSYRVVDDAPKGIHRALPYLAISAGRGERLPQKAAVEVDEYVPSLTRVVDDYRIGTKGHARGILQFSRVVTATHALRATNTLITADAGYHSKTNLEALAAMRVPALIADNEMRGRDERFATQDRYTVLPHPLHNKSAPVSPSSPCFTPNDFVYDADARTCTCPAGKSLYRKGRANMTKDYVGEHVRGAKRDGVPCTLRATCLRSPDATAVRNVAFFRGRVEPDTRHPRDTRTMRMKARIDSATGREQYGRRFATVKPVFANLRHNKLLDRFTLHGRTKVDGQWKLFCLVHNIEKLACAGYAA